MKKKIAVSSKTTYVLSLSSSNEHHLLKLYHIINGVAFKRPLLYYRINHEPTAIVYYQRIIDIIKENKERLCVDNLKNWIFNVHVIKYLMSNQN